MELAIISILLVAFVVAVIFAIFSFTPKNYSGDSPSQDKQELQSVEDANRQAVNNWLAERTNRFNEWRCGLEKQYGPADVCLSIDKNETDRTIIIWKDKQLFHYNGQTISFKDILGYDISNIPSTSSSRAVATTKTNLMDEINRKSATSSFGDVVGTAVSGPLRQETIVTSTGGKITQSYVVYIYINDFANSLIEINAGSNADISHKIISYLNIILSSVSK